MPSIANTWVWPSFNHASKLKFVKVAWVPGGQFPQNLSSFTCHCKFTHPLLGFKNSGLGLGSQTWVGMIIV